MCAILECALYQGAVILIMYKHIQALLFTKLILFVHYWLFKFTLQMGDYAVVVFEDEAAVAFVSFSWIEKEGTVSPFINQFFLFFCVVNRECSIKRYH